MVETTSCLTSPGSVRQASGVAVGVGGIGLGVNVAVLVAVGEGGMVMVEGISVGEEQAESPARSVRRAVLRIA